MGDDMKLFKAEHDLADLPGTFRTAACISERPSVTLTLSPMACLKLARVIEHGLEPDRLVVVERDAPMKRHEVFIHSLCLGLMVFSVFGDAVLGLIDLIRLVLA